MRLLLLLIGLTACTPFADVRPLRTCDADDPTVDCCESDEACQTYFGPGFPFCQDPGRATGRCVECTVDEHCSLDAYCAPHPELGAYCAPLPLDDGP